MILCVYQSCPSMRIDLSRLPSVAPNTAKVILLLIPSALLGDLIISSFHLMFQTMQILVPSTQILLLFVIEHKTLLKLFTEVRTFM